MAFGVAYVLPVILAGIFAFSAVGKWMDPTGGAHAMRAFGLSPALARLVAGVLPWVEAVLAAVLLVGTGIVFRAAAWTAAALMVAFAVVFSVQILRGRRPPCHCFGALSAEPISWGAVARNLAIAGLGVFIGVNYPRWQGVWVNFYAADRATRFEFVISLALAALLVAMWIRSKTAGNDVRALQEQVAQLEGNLVAMTRVRENAEPEPVPDVAVVRAADDRPFSLTELSQPLSRLVVFVSPSCSQCGAAVQAAVRWQPALAGTVELALVSIDDAPNSRLTYGEEPVELYLDLEHRAFDAVGARGTPAAVLLGANGIIAAGPVHGPALIGDLLRDIGQMLQSGAASGPA